MAGCRELERSSGRESRRIDIKDVGVKVHGEIASEDVYNNDYDSIVVYSTWRAFSSVQIMNIHSQTPRKIRFVELI